MSTRVHSVVGKHIDTLTSHIIQLTLLAVDLNDNLLFVILLILWLIHFESIKSNSERSRREHWLLTVTMSQFQVALKLLSIFVYSKIHIEGNSIIREFCYPEYSRTEWPLSANQHLLWIEVRFIVREKKELNETNHFFVLHSTAKKKDLKNRLDDQMENQMKNWICWVYRCTAPNRAQTLA